ncbi:hypothetical protein N0M98_29860 [Paenibacillus doosanensis]|uniref:Telomeric repeat-binding factor 2 n=1 Tax=Paenibacillus konkukensis TaxID=2020716 RepID=A0ABY4S107_9BACL|nr:MULTISPECIES: hypothetical protein [Paenibacillus]MCS7464313.1 hypothetical protein [Paenibacillus doosanensis]UQZ87580.1 Telomeric repeat-binding factor 2 [Paenibacillus konkukensis]
MNPKLKKTAAVMILSASLMSTGYSAFAEETTPAVAAEVKAQTVYPLTDQLEVEVKSILNEHVPEGTRIGVVVRMKNNYSDFVRVPEYELRVKTEDGTEYKLEPSASNAKAIQSKANTELSYMAVIDRTDDVALSEVNWTDVDYYVYPKKQTLILAIPVAGQSWQGSDMQIKDEAAVKKWSDSFKIPSLISPIQYTPVNIDKQSTEQGTVYVVQLLAYNPTDKRETVPDFLVDGKTGAKVFSGKRVEEGQVVLEGKEEKYIHYAIPTEQDTVLSSLNVLTTENFTQAPASAGAAPEVVKYNVGRLNILLPSQTLGNSYETYAMGSAMKFDSRSELIHPDIDVSLVEFEMQDNEEEGNKNVTAKFKLYNKSDRPMAIPVFDADLVSAEGYEYTGKRQTITDSPILPNGGITVNYSFALPVSESGQGLAMKIGDPKTAAPYKTTIAAYRVALQQPEDGAVKFNVYPFRFDLTHWDISFQFNSQTFEYSYKGKFFMDIEREPNVQVDANFSKLQFELYDSAGRLVGTSTNSFIGPNRLVTGENNIVFKGTSQQFDAPLTLKVYEVYTTASGESKRLVTQLTQ